MTRTGISDTPKGAPRRASAINCLERTNGFKSIPTGRQAKTHTIQGVRFAGEPNVNYPNSILSVGEGFGFVLKLE